MTYTNLYQFFYLGTTPVLAPTVWANENPKVGTLSRARDLEADALSHNHSKWFIKLPKLSSGFSLSESDQENHCKLRRVLSQVKYTPAK